MTTTRLPYHPMAHVSIPITVAEPIPDLCFQCGATDQRMKLKVFEPFTEETFRIGRYCVDLEGCIARFNAAAEAAGHLA